MRDDQESTTNGPDSDTKGTALQLLHTAEVHVATFDRLLKQSGTSARWGHHVAEELLERARGEGLTASLRDELREALRGLAKSCTGNGLILCTCSTLGGLAEEMSGEIGRPVLRLDRALAEAALAKANQTKENRVTVLCAVASTIEPTKTLFEDVARSMEWKGKMELELVEDVWDLFLGGDNTGYLQKIAEVIRVVEPKSDVVVLAQASMAGAAELLPDIQVPILSSPKLGVEKALAMLAAES